MILEDNSQFVKYLVDLSEKNSQNITNISQDLSSIKTYLHYVVPTKDQMFLAIDKHSKNPFAHGKFRLSKKALIGLIASILALIPIAVAAYNSIFVD